MNRNILKDYAPRARTAFIQAVTDKAAVYGITGKSVLPCEVKGDFAFINGRPFPKIVDTQRKELLKQISEHSFGYVMEEIAYTWFNRFAAVRFMEVNGYLSHGYRVLGHPERHNIPEIVEKAQFVGEMPGLDREEIIRLKMAGDRDDELYRKLLIAQCNELSRAMPFLFEKVDDPTELLLPDSLLHTGSIIRDMVETIPEEDWRQVEIIGWLYQFYISQKKDVLMKAKKAYKSEDIPAVTQLFTPNWIVKYLIQNSLGAKWLRTYPTSNLKAKMEYYIEPADQTPEVNEELKRITPSSLNPEELTVMDPACGSGHIMVEAYDLLKEIYLERGYRRRDIPQLILEKNLFGLEIDERAAQLAGFALMMKARRDDSGIFERNAKPNVLVIKAVTGEGAKLGLEVFKNANTFGSLTRIPDSLRENLPIIETGIDELEKKGDLLSHNVISDLKHVLRQAELLSRKYDVVVANPPYMGRRKMNLKLKKLADKEYPNTKSDLFAMFIERGFEMSKSAGHNAMVTMESWMFLSSYEKFRDRLTRTVTIESMVHMPYLGKGGTSMGINFGTSAVVFHNIHRKKARGHFCCVRYYETDDNGIPLDFPTRNERSAIASAVDLRKIPGSPIAYWVSDHIRALFGNRSLEEDYIPKFGMSVGNGEKYIRLWYEVDFSKIGFGFCNEDDFFNRGYIWGPLDKGGDFRKWYGNKSHVVFWENRGYDIRNSQRSAVRSPQYFFKPRFSWTLISTRSYSARYFEYGYLIDTASNCVYFKDNKPDWRLLLFLNTDICRYLLKLLNPTLNYSCGVIGKLPSLLGPGSSDIVMDLIQNAKLDWDSSETSWDFLDLPILRDRETREQSDKELADEKVTLSFCPSVTLSMNLNGYVFQSLSSSYQRYCSLCQGMTDKMHELEKESNRIFIDSYSLQNEIASNVPVEEITLFANPKYRYGTDLADNELEARFRGDTMKELISYAMGCMMGRYSLDEPGLIYAYSGNTGFDESRYKTFPADTDGIIPITDIEWFDDDAALRFFRFIGTAWAKDGLEDNFDFIADAIGRKPRESSREAIRRYFVSDFFKDHLKTYKKRPIYWLFSSGNQKAFQALVYLHRYNEGTLSRMRTEYVLPLQSMISRRIENLERDREAASSTSAANKIQREIDKLRRQQEELLRFDEKLRRYADMRIKLDLNDGVKVNYGKFGDLLTEVKAVTGSSE